MQHSYASLATISTSQHRPKAFWPEPPCPCAELLWKPPAASAALIASSPRALQRHGFRSKFNAPPKNASFPGMKFPTGRDAMASQKLCPPSSLDLDRDVKDLSTL